MSTSSGRIVLAGKVWALVMITYLMADYLLLI
jgi:hypothetical protein